MQITPLEAVWAGAKKYTHESSQLLLTIVLIKHALLSQIR
jgi:hypothetical protein